MTKLVDRIEDWVAMSLASFLGSEFWDCGRVLVVDMRVDE
jgi:hypothetical protein